MEGTLDTPFGDTKKAFPEVYNSIPVQPKHKKPGQLSEEQLKQFFDQGFIVIEDYFERSLLDEVKKDISKSVDYVAELLYKAGKVKDLYKDYGFYKRLTKLEEDFTGATVIIHKCSFLPESIKKVWANERVLNVMEQFLGTQDIKGNPVWNLRTKTPNNEATVVPWHQDVAYMDNDSHHVLQMTAWIPLLDSNKQNGCMQVIKGGHKKGNVVPHYGCWKNTHYVEIIENEMEEILGVNVERDTVTCEVPYGGVLFFSNILPHRSLPNLSQDIRWSLDLRWQRYDQPAGFYGLSEGVPLRASEPTFKVDWNSFTGSNSSLKRTVDSITENGTDFNILIPGPWMKKWKIINKNRHIEAWEQGFQRETSYHGLIKANDK